MRQHKTLAQILLILSIFNLVLAAPVERKIYDTHDDAVVPLAERDVEVMSKERRQPTSDGADGPTPSGSSQPDELTSSHPLPPSSDVSTPSHQQPLPDGSTPTVSNSPPPLSEGSSPSSTPPPDGEESLGHGPTPPDGPISLAVSPPPDGTEASPHVPTTDQSVPASSEIEQLPPETSVQATGRPRRTPEEVMMALQTYAANQEELMRELMERQRESRERFNNVMKNGAKGLAILAIGGGLVAYFRHHHHGRTIDPLADSSTAKGSGHPCLDD